MGKAGQTVEISSPDKVLFPESKITKQELADYYEAVSPFMLPHLKDRPVSLQRYPNGIDGTNFFQKEASEYFPKFIKRIKIKLKNGETKPYILINNGETLLYLTNLACIPIHTWLSSKGSINKPDTIIWDLDPSDGDFEKVREAGILMCNMFEEAGIKPFLKTTGSRGLHIILSLEPEHAFIKTRKLAKAIADKLATLHPDLLTTEMSKDERGDRVFVDYLRNGFAQTAIAPYSVRAKEKAPVSAPISREELEDKKISAQTFTISNILPRLEREGDLLKSLHRKSYSLTRLEKLL